jgi:hypothetical protein
LSGRDRQLPQSGHRVGPDLRCLAMSNATVRSNFVLRACITNHRTTNADAAAVVDEVLATAADLPQ